jgi:hypothetical protein
MYTPKNSGYGKSQSNQTLDWLTFTQQSKVFKPNIISPLQQQIKSYDSGQSQVFYAKEFDETPIRPMKH